MVLMRFSSSLSTMLKFSTVVFGCHQEVFDGSAFSEVHLYPVSLHTFLMLSHRPFMYGTTMWHLWLLEIEVLLVHVLVPVLLFAGLVRQTSPRPYMLHTYPLAIRYMDDIISINKKEQVDTLFNHLKSVNPHIKFTMEAPGNDHSISFLDTKCSPNSEHNRHTSM